METASPPLDQRLPFLDPKPTTFHLFLTLPIELQDRIWELSVTAEVSDRPVYYVHLAFNNELRHLGERLHRQRGLPAAFNIFNFNIHRTAAPGSRMPDEHVCDVAPKLRKVCHRARDVVDRFYPERHVGMNRLGLDEEVTRIHPPREFQCGVHMSLKPLYIDPLSSLVVLPDGWQSACRNWNARDVGGDHRHDRNLGWNTGGHIRRVLTGDWPHLCHLGLLWPGPSTPAWGSPPETPSRPEGSEFANRHRLEALFSFFCSRPADDYRLNSLHVIIDPAHLTQSAERMPGATLPKGDSNWAQHWDQYFAAYDDDPVDETFRFFDTLRAQAFFEVPIEQVKKMRNLEEPIYLLDCIRKMALNRVGYSSYGHGAQLGAQQGAQQGAPDQKSPIRCRIMTWGYARE